MSCFLHLRILILLLLGWPSLPAFAEASLDLSGAKLGPRQVVLLNGPWDFYWDKLIEDPLTHLPPDGSWPAGRSWTNFIKDGQPLPSVGQASYRLRLHGLKAGTYTFKYRSLEAAVLLRVFDVQTGQPVLTMKAGDILSEPPLVSKKDQLLELPLEEGHEYIFLLNIKSYIGHMGGFTEVPELSLGTFAQRQHEYDGLLNALCLGVCLASCVSTILMWVRRREDRASFYLFLICFAAIIRIITTNQSMIHLFDDENFLLLKRLEYASMAVSMVFVYFMHHAFPQIALPRLLLRLYAGATWFLVLAALVLPSLVFTSMLAIYQIAILCGALLVIYVNARALLHRLPGSGLAAAGCVVVLSAVAYDILLVSRFKIFAYFIGSIGVALYMMLQAQLVAVQAALTYKLAERLARENEAAQKALRIETETRFGLATAVAHRLNNPMNYIQMGLNDLRGQISLLRERIVTLLGPDQESDPELRSVKESFEQIFSDVRTPFLHAEKGLTKASASIEEIRTLSGIDGISLQELKLGWLMQQVAERMTEQVDGTSYRRLSFQCQNAEASFHGNLYLLKNVIEIFIGHSLQLSEGPLEVLTDASTSPKAWKVHLRGSLANDPIEWQVLEERLSYVLKPLGTSLAIGIENELRTLTIREPAADHTREDPLIVDLPLAS